MDVPSTSSKNLVHSMMKFWNFAFYYLPFKIISLIPVSNLMFSFLYPQKKKVCVGFRSDIDMVIRDDKSMQ